MPSIYLATAFTSSCISSYSVHYSIAYIAINANMYNKEYTKQTQTDTQPLEYCG